MKIEGYNFEDCSIYFKLPKRLSFDDKFVVITNKTIYKLYKDHLKLKFGINFKYILIDDGEKYKNMDSVNYIIEGLFELDVDKSFTLIAFGGGVICDIVGFVSSIYKRGLTHILIPTTLLSMVDASVGGKTGVNSSFGKNMIGTFKMPKAVYIDSYYLTTLSKREYSAGLSEIIKIAVVLDIKFFTYLESIDPFKIENIKKIIKRSITLKRDIVVSDYKEGGVRKVLNYGHTYGHIVEFNTNYKRFLHGEAVSIGINFANNIAYKLGFITKREKDRVTDLLVKCKLPIYYNDINITNFKKHLLNDKKSGYNSINYILPKGLGNYIFMYDINYDLCEEVLLNFK